MLKFILSFLLMQAAGQTLCQEVKILEKQLDAVKKVKMILGSRNLNVSTWNSDKIKIEVRVDGKDGLEASEALKKTGFIYKQVSDTLLIESGTPFSFDNFDVDALGLEMLPGRKFITHMEDKLYYYNGKEMIPLEKALKQVGKYAEFERLFTKATISIFIPKHIALEIENDFGFVNVEQDLSQLTLRGSSLQMHCKNVNNMVLDLSYSAFTGGDLGSLRLKATDSKIYADNSNDVHAITSGSTIELKHVKTLKLESQGDEIRLGETGSLTGIKDYGRLYIDKLNDKLELKAENEELRVRAFGLNAKQMNVTNKFGSLFLPVATLRGYEIQLIGENIYTSGTPKFSITEKATDNKTIKTAVFGDRSLNIRLICEQCTITF